MTPYLNHLKNQYKLRISSIPFQLFMEFEMFEALKKDIKKLEALYRLVNNANWCKSKYMKMIINKSRRLMPVFKADLKLETCRPLYTEYKKTIRLMEQFLTASEMEEFIADNESFADSIVDYYNFSRNKEEEIDLRYEEVLEEINSFLESFPSKNKPFNEMLSELSFKLFVLVADADENLDNKERIEFLRIIRDPEWCVSQCARAAFNSTSYFFSEFLLQFRRGKIKKELKDVERTLKIVDMLFTEDEAGLIKHDLARLSQEIAKASGGFGGIMAISRSEGKVIKRIENLLGDLSEVQVSKRSNVVE